MSWLREVPDWYRDAVIGKVWLLGGKKESVEATEIPLFMRKPGKLGEDQVLILSRMIHRVCPLEPVRNGAKVDSDRRCRFFIDYRLDGFAVEIGQRKLERFERNVLIMMPEPSARCFAMIKDWVEKKIRRHLMRARKRKGFGWKRWSKEWLHNVLGLFNGYRTRYYEPQQKVAPAR